MDKFSEMSRVERIAYLASKVALAKSYDSPVLTVPIPDLETLLAELESKSAYAADWCHSAKKRKDLLDDANKRIAELEAIRGAAEKLVRCKGRYHSEQNYRALAALFGVTTPDLPPVDGDGEAVIAELRAKLSEMTTFRDNAVKKNKQRWEELLSLRAKLATPVRLPALLQPERDAVNEMIFANGRNEAIAECSVAIRQAGFLSEASPMTIEGDE